MWENSLSHYFIASWVPCNYGTGIGRSSVRKDRSGEASAPRIEETDKIIIRYASRL